MYRLIGEAETRRGPFIIVATFILFCYFFFYRMLSTGGPVEAGRVDERGGYRFKKTAD